MGEAITMSDISPKRDKHNKVKSGNSIIMSDIHNKGEIDRIINKSYKTKYLYEYFPSGIWKNRRCFIVGGGPSLKGFDFSKLKGELVIAVNRAFEYVPNAAIMIAQDARLWGWYENGELGEEARNKFNNFKGYKSWVNCQSFPYPDDIYVINSTYERNFDWEDYNYAKGLPWCTNTGLDALCLAVCLGANPIYLLGFDCEGKDGRTANFHSGYPDYNDESIYVNNFIPNFNDFAPAIKKITKVINLNPKSKLKCFEFGDFNDIKPLKIPLITSCYTIGTKYEDEARRLEKSLIRMGLRYHFEGIPNTGDWRHNVHEKVKFIRRCLDKINEDIIQMDADCEVVRYPELFEQLNGCDIACNIMPKETYWFNNEKKEITDLTNVSVIYLKNSKKVKKMLDAWVELDSTLEDHIDDISFAKNLKQFPNMKVFKLPLSYCHIYDRPLDKSGEPVIELYQANRRLRNTVMFKEGDIIPTEQSEKKLYEKLWKEGYIPSQCAMPLAVYISKTADKKWQLLDIGCGDGSTVQTLRLMDYNCKGLDITNAGIKINNTTPIINKPLGKWFIESSITRTGLLDNIFDYTFSTDVLEHIPEDKVDDAISEIIRITKIKTFHVIALFSDIRNGIELHKTIKPISWWQKRFEVLNNKGIEVCLVDRAEFLGSYKIGTFSTL